MRRCIGWICCRKPDIFLRKVTSPFLRTCGFMKPKRMDVVIFQRSDATRNVKRVIGLPGETVVIQNGRIYIDGTLLESDQISDISLGGIAEKPVELMEDEYFLIGDNADSSEDSRFINVGNVKRSQILGRIWFRLLPFKKIGFIK